MDSRHGFAFFDGFRIEVASEVGGEVGGGVGVEHLAHQAALRHRPGLRGRPRDGRPFGRQTLNRVNRFQGDFHCAGGVDGVVGANTFSCPDWVTDNRQGV
ncbi:hypothetical protein AQI88_28155 [Streptomyces cellostaticus]|uniref:Peptidoglycan binding-like domain-containing protein n=1 Tax=Streptomyces cellostaticus TaxID=67285 RepID=A0A124HC17_9ACTN|nr:hypothetical protein AQI88_28155 [Streptomyces cellostaticus]GHI06019.1 hypothetical protein Scel_43400 [Streptomyces cellostaticus]